MPIHPRRFVTLLSGLAAALLACAGSPPEPSPPGPPPPADGLHILFIGNSLTYVNDLPGTVKRLGAAVDGKPPTIESVAFANYSLEDHWNRGDAQRAIAGGTWDLVVLQQGPSALPESRVLLVDYTTRFASEIEKAGGRTAMYMVWPESDRAAVWDDVTESYASAARAVDGMLMPAGEAFRSAVRVDPGLELLAGDGFHPSASGTYLAALVIYAQATGRSPEGMSAVAHLIDLSPAASHALEAGAADAIERFGIP